MNYPKPFGDRILVKRKKSESKIIITSDIKNEGVVVALGEDTKEKPMRLQLGQNVMFTGYGMTTISMADDKENTYLLMMQNDVIAVLTPILV